MRYYWYLLTFTCLSNLSLASPTFSVRYSVHAALSLAKASRIARGNEQELQNIDSNMKFGILLCRSRELYVPCVILSRIWFLIWDAWRIFTFLFMVHPLINTRLEIIMRLWVLKLLQRKAHLMWADKRLGTVAGSPRYIEPPESSQFEC